MAVTATAGVRDTAMNAHALPAVRSASYGMLAFGLLLGAYFGLLALISGWQFTLDQFYQFWIYLVGRNDDGAAGDAARRIQATLFPLATEMTS